MAHLTDDPANRARWTSVYPVYIDKNRTIAQGRRIAKEKAVELAHPRFIMETLESKELGLEYYFEHKAYSRDHLSVARFRVHLFDENRKPINSAIKNKRDLLNYIAEQVPQTAAWKEWKVKVAEHEQKEKERKEKEEREATKAANAKAQQGSSTKKKGKKKK